jgi:hypothetical protein
MQQMVPSTLKLAVPMTACRMDFFCKPCFSASKIVMERLG